MKKYESLVEAFTDANKEICKAGIAVEPKDVYLAYCALALCTIADKMGEEEPENCVGCKHLTDPCELFPTDACKRCRRHYDDRYEEKDAETESGKTKL